MKKNKLLQRLYIAAIAITIFGSCKMSNVISANRIKTWYFSPIPAIGTGPNGLPTKNITVNPYCCPSDAIEITAVGPAGDNDFQWVNIPLSLPADTIISVRVCYNTTNGAYISQTRLSNMTTPDHALVVLDDGTDQKSATATCYTTAANVKVNGTVTLSLRVVVPQNGSITVGSIAIELK